jgi:hypothetical protein
MSPTIRTVVVMFLLLSGCGSCQRDGETPAGAPPAAPGNKPGAEAPIVAPGKIQVTPLQPTAPGREAAVPKAPVEGGVAPMPPEGGAAAGAGQPGDEGDCIVVADAQPDYGPPPLAVAFSSEAECSAGQPTYKWDFGDASSPSSEPNPSHTYTKAGDYTASVTVTSPGGTTASDEIDITVEEGEPEAQ